MTLFHIGNRYFVEFLGTMFLVFTILATNNFLAIGSALAIIVFLGGPVSGGAFNPAVVFALYAAQKIHRSDLVPYILAEVLGALTGFEIYKRFVSGKKE